MLRSTLTSPFGRKVRMAAEVLGLMDRITLVPADPLDENDTLRAQNPLGKMPCLLTADGSAIYDSGVIIEYLQEVAGTDRLLPARGPARFQALTRARLADGITEAALLVVYEGRFRDDPARIRNAGSSISAASSCARWPPSKRRRPIRATPISSRSAYLARSAISTGASRWNGALHFQTCRPGLWSFRSTSRRSNARARKTA